MIVRRRNRSYIAASPYLFFICTLLLIALAAACGSAEGDAGEQSGALSVADVWSRPAVLLGGDHDDHGAEDSDSATVGVVYLTIENHGDGDDRLLSANTDVAEDVEIHSTTVTGGVMQMRPAQGGVDVPAGQLVRFEPGGLHIMLVGLTRSLELGDEFDVRLTFEQAGEMTVRSEVRDE